MPRYETALLPLLTRMRQKAHDVCTGSIQRDYLLSELQRTRFLPVPASRYTGWLLAAKSAASRYAIVQSMAREKVMVAARGGVLQEMVDAVHALSDEPSAANVERYLASSRALEDSHHQSPERKGRHARKTRDPVHS